MREIKFKAWDTENKKMIEWENLHLDKDKDGLFIWIGDDYNDHYGNSTGSDDFELLQYTGLKDKNGKEIYEGDVVAFTLEEYQIRGKVIKGNGCFGISFDDLDNETLEKYTLYDNWYRGMYIDNYLTLIEIIWNFEEDFEGCLETIEIIGNIYENPKLLEEDSK